MLTDADVVIGKIVAPFGTKGEVKVAILTDFPDRFEAGRNVTLLMADSERREHRIEASRLMKEMAIVKPSGVLDRVEAEKLRGADIVIDRAEVAPLVEGCFYIFDLMGMNVQTTDGRELGVIVEVIQAAGNDVYVTSDNVCIPAIKDVVKNVDLSARVMKIEPIPGLLTE